MGFEQWHIKVGYTVTLTCIWGVWLRPGIFEHSWTVVCYGHTCQDRMGIRMVDDHWKPSSKQSRNHRTQCCPWPLDCSQSLFCFVPQEKNITVKLARLPDRSIPKWWLHWNHWIALAVKKPKNWPQLLDALDVQLCTLVLLFNFVFVFVFFRCATISRFQVVS